MPELESESPNKRTENSGLYIAGEK